MVMRGRRGGSWRGGGSRCGRRRRCEVVRWEKTLALSHFQPRRQLLFPFGTTILEPSFDLNLSQMQRFGQFKALRHAQVFVNLQHTHTIVLLANEEKINFVCEMVSSLLHRILFI
jgi:hypothetical protein